MEEKGIKADKMGDLLKVRYPDIDPEDKEGYADRLGADFEDYDSGVKQRKEMNDLLASDPDAANILSGMATGLNNDGSPFSLVDYLAEAYWDELSTAKDSDDFVKKVAARKAKEDEADAKGAKNAQDASDNLAAADAALDELVQSGEFSEEKVRKMLDWLYADEVGFLPRLLRNDITTEDWRKLLQLQDFDGTMENAKRAGYKEGKNEKIDMMREKETARADMPVDLGSGGKAEEAKHSSTADVYGAMKPRFA